MHLGLNAAHPPPNRKHRAHSQRPHATMAAEDGGRLRVSSALEAVGAYAGPLDVDLGNLCASDPAPIDPEVFGDGAAVRPEPPTTGTLKSRTLRSDV